MTRIDFHSNVGDSLLYACRLARKAYLAGQPLVVLAESARLLAFDEMLWTFSPLDFVPHCMAATPLAADTPVVLATNLDSTCRIIRCCSIWAQRCRRSSRASKDCSKWSVTHMKNSPRAASAIASIAIAAML
ncbi:hypothetical protein OKW42_009074 [Paraburkholderia sp. WC7.3d]